jgi:hypothetical protein
MTGGVCDPLPDPRQWPGESARTLEVAATSITGRLGRPDIMLVMQDVTSSFTLGAAR